MENETIDHFNEKLHQKLIEVADGLYPYFDSVLIIATKHECNAIGTSRFSKGVGNFYANVGAVELWLKEQKQNVEKEDDD